MVVQILACSPHAGGSAETIASIIAEGVAASGISAPVVPLRTHLIRPCTGCGYCTHHPGDCMLDGDGDEALKLLQSIRKNDLTIFVIPVYFYGPPALFKGLVDRAQRYWSQHENRSTETSRRNALAILCAARTRGEKLFEPNLLILRCFLNLLGLRLHSPLLLRGIETPADILGNAHVLSCLNDMGNQAARLIREQQHA